MLKIKVTKITAFANSWVAIGPGTSMSGMDPVVCFISAGSDLSCGDYTMSDGETYSAP